MVKKLRFENIQGDWFVDLPDYIEAGGNYADLQMVLGADQMLDILSNGEEIVDLMISNSPLAAALRLTRSHEEYDGMWYNISSPQGSEWTELEGTPKTCWLCGVTKYVFAEFPNEIYIRQTI